MEKIMNLSVNVEEAKKYLEKNELWWFSCPPYTITEFDRMIEERQLIVVDVKKLQGTIGDGIAKDYESPMVKRYSAKNNMRITAIYATERAQMWADAQNVCEIGMANVKKISACSILETMRQNCDYSGYWITDATKEVQKIKIDNYYGYHAQYLHDLDKYLEKLQNLLGDLRYELHWKLLQIEGKDEGVDSYIQSIKTYD